MTNTAIQDVIKQTVKETVKSLADEKFFELKLLSVQETMELLGVSRSTLWLWENRELLKPINVGGIEKYRYTDVMDFINRNNE